jgi:hypothetical protein
MNVAKIVPAKLTLYDADGNSVTMDGYELQVEGSEPRPSDTLEEALDAAKIIFGGGVRLVGEDVVLDDPPSDAEPTPVVAPTPAAFEPSPQPSPEPTAL